MLQRLRQLLNSVGSDDDTPTFTDDDKRLAFAALMVHCVAVDGVAGAGELAKVRAILKAEYGLSGAALEELIEEAKRVDAEAIDLYRFTSVLKRQMSIEERIRAVERLWEIVYVDGEVHEFEDNLVWRVAELLGVDRNVRIALKHAVAERRIAEEPG
ncbi:tellurite resistance TerB family protein [Afifella pfennigii]|uniref:tellurite resistance TerB family protein n=1 Tax=Afifella pfennigii TaxID=209897 RepID=UPI00047E7367|nr:TerB family tellurite resistance protein [Afifella pfennigii]